MPVDKHARRIHPFVEKVFGLVELLLGNQNRITAKQFGLLVD
jgi:hypothetical protein